MNSISLKIIVGAMLLASATVFAANAESQETSQQRDARLAWWREARFGMFIHWGPVSLRGTEIGWSRGDQVPVEVYDQLYRQFNPAQFNADQWVATAKAAGMKYLVLTTKHHDGFCLWNTQFTDYNIMNTPFHRDVVKELASACKKHGLKFCAYHSICDWRHPDYPLGSPGGKSPKPDPNMDRYNQYLKNQLAELIQNYGPLGILWFDGEWEKPWSHERGVDLYQYVRQLQPGIIINNRVGIGRAGMEGSTTQGAFASDYDTPEQQVGKFQNDRPWETCMTICQQWAWKTNDTMKSLKQCLQTLVYCAGGDGNLLFNVGPMPTGEIEPRQVERLKEMGQWLKRYGKSVYATRGGPFKPGRWGASTSQGKKIYLHVFQWPAEGLALPPINQKIQSAKVLTGGKAAWSQTQDHITIKLPEKEHQDIDTIIELKVNGQASQITPVKVVVVPRTAGPAAKASLASHRVMGLPLGAE